MEITLHTPLHEWYVETPNNPLSYWGIDYPPLSAYQSYATGLVMMAIEPASMELSVSRGYETPSSKRAMRLTVILWDLLGAHFLTNMKSNCGSPSTTEPLEHKYHHDGSGDVCAVQRDSVQMLEAVGSSLFL
jgi:hypothetical protein